MMRMRCRLFHVRPEFATRPGSDVDRHLAHGKLQPVLHPADINGQYSRHHSGSDRVDLLRRRAYQPVAREGRTQSHFPGDGIDPVEHCSDEWHCCDQARFWPRLTHVAHAARLELRSPQAVQRFKEDLHVLTILKKFEVVGTN